MAEGFTLAEGAKQLAQIVRASDPEQAESLALIALKSVKLAAYREILMAAGFHSGPMGRGLVGLREGIARSIEAQEGELSDGR